MHATDELQPNAVIHIQIISIINLLLTKIFSVADTQLIFVFRIVVNSVGISTDVSVWVAGAFVAVLVE